MKKMLPKLENAKYSNSFELKKTLQEFRKAFDKQVRAGKKENALLLLDAYIYLENEKTFQDNL